MTCSTIALSPFATFSTTTPRRTLPWAPNHQLRHSHPPSNPHATPHAPFTFTERTTPYISSENGPRHKKQEHRQDTEDRANNAYTEKRDGRQRRGGRSGLLCWRPRVRGLPNRGIGSVSHPRGLRAVWAPVLTRLRDACFGSAHHGGPADGVPLPGKAGRKRVICCTARAGAGG